MPGVAGMVGLVIGGGAFRARPSMIAPIRKRTNATMERYQPIEGPQLNDPDEPETLAQLLPLQDPK